MLGTDPAADEVAEWTRRVLPRDDAATWFIRNYRKDPNIFNQKNKEKLEHFSGMAHLPEVKDVRLNKEHSFEDGLGLLYDAERRGVERTKNRPGIIPASGKKILDAGNGYAWYSLGKGSCPDEAKAMGHCGNEPSAVNGDNILSLRKEHEIGGQAFHEPHLTFIENNGWLGETKGRANEKPSPKYHDAIAKLLTSKHIKKNIGGGYGSHSNFQVSDLSPELQKKVLAANPKIENIDGLADADVPDKHKEDIELNEYSQVGDFFDIPKEYKQKLVESRYFNPEHMEQALDDADEGVRFVAVLSPYFKPEHMEQALNDSNSSVRAQAVRSPHSTPEHIERALSDSNSRVRAAAVESRHSTPEHMERALNDSDPIVREAVIRSPHFKPEHMERMLSDSNYGVRQMAVLSPHFKPEHMEQALNNSDPMVRRFGIGSPHFKPEHMERALNDSDPMVRQAAALSPYFKPEHMERALSDSAPMVRTVAVQSPHFKPEHMEQALSDSHPGVRKAAVQSRHFKPEHMDRINDMKKHLTKALTAGYGGAGSPSSMTGGSVLQTESIDSKSKSNTFKYISCPNCGKEQPYLTYQVKCRGCNKSFPFDALAKYFLSKADDSTKASDLPKTGLGNVDRPEEAKGPFKHSFLNDLSDRIGKDAKIKNLYAFMARNHNAPPVVQKRIHNEIMKRLQDLHRGDKPIEVEEQYSHPHFNKFHEAVQSDSQLQELGHVMSMADKRGLSSDKKSLLRGEAFKRLLGLHNENFPSIMPRPADADDAKPAKKDTGSVVISGDREKAIEQLRDQSSNVKRVQPPALSQKQLDRKKIDQKIERSYVTGEDYKQMKTNPQISSTGNTYAFHTDPSVLMTYPSKKLQDGNYQHSPLRSQHLVVINGRPIGHAYVQHPLPNAKNRNPTVIPRPDGKDAKERASNTAIFNSNISDIVENLQNHLKSEAFRQHVRDAAEKHNRGATKVPESSGALNADEIKDALKQRAEREAASSSPANVSPKGALPESVEPKQSVAMGNDTSVVSESEANRLKRLRGQAPGVRISSRENVPSKTPETKTRQVPLGTISAEERQKLGEDSKADPKRQK